MRLLVTDAAAQPPRQATAWLIMTLGRTIQIAVSTLKFIWLCGIGLICIALPHIWWPSPRGLLPLLHFSTFAGLIFFAVRGQRTGGVFDHERADWRGLLGVVAYSLVFIGSAFVYRLLLL